MQVRTILLTAVAMVAFAANSVLCRMALKDGLIDPVAFTQVRLLSGALVLLPFLIARRAFVVPVRARDWQPALALFVYAIAFSLAYVALDAGVGALILFAMVQASMIGLGMAQGARPSGPEWIGWAIAFAGLLYLLAPGLSAPPAAGAALMAVAGVAWGAYSVLGKAEADAVASTARNFVLTVPLALALFVAGAPWSEAAPAGLALAVASGAVTSGLGYVIWYAALRDLTHATASTVQLSVPIIAAIGGVLLLSEATTLRLVLATVLILGGVFLSIRAGSRARS